MKVRVAHESGAKMMHAFRPICLGRAESILIDGKASLVTVEVDLLTDQTLPRVSCRDPPAAFQGRAGSVRFGTPGQNNDHHAVGVDGYRRVAQILPLAPHRARCGARLFAPCIGLAPQCRGWIFRVGRPNPHPSFPTEFNDVVGAEYCRWLTPLEAGEPVHGAFS